MSVLLFCVLAAAFVFEFINGFHDTANAIATAVYTRALPVRVAIFCSATMNFLGALMSESVALTISKGLVGIQLDLYVLLATLVGVIIWNLFTWWYAIPSSSSHALIGSLIGATLVATGNPVNVVWTGVLQKVIIPIFTSPLIGFVLGYIFMSLLYEICANVQLSRANFVFHKAQIVSSMFMAYSHGNNDAQKTMGIITIALISTGLIPVDSGVPMWVKIFCATVMALGTSIGGRRIMKTVGSGVTKLDPSIGFVTQCASGIAIEVMTALGAPVSTTQVITTSIMGAGTSRGAKKVKWGIGYQMLTAWIIALPVTMLIGGLVAFLIGLFL